MGQGAPQEAPGAALYWVLSPSLVKPDEVLGRAPPTPREQLCWPGIWLLLMGTEHDHPQLSPWQAFAAELDDIRAAGSDAEDNDVAAAVAAAVARDRAVERELAASQHARFARFAGDSDDEAGGPARGGGGTRGANGAHAPSAAAELDRFAGSSSEEENDGAAGFVDFGGGDFAEEERRRRAKRRKKEAGSAAGTAGTAAATGQKKSRAGAVSVRPGELVHAGTDVPLAAQGQLFANSDAAAGDGGAARGGFAGLGLSEQLAAHLAAHGFAQPTRVQQQTIPVLLVSPAGVVQSGCTTADGRSPA